jgi:hypothetical protein
MNLPPNNTVEVDEMGWASSVYGQDKKCIQTYQSENLKGRHYSEDPDNDRGWG